MSRADRGAPLSPVAQLDRRLREKLDAAVPILAVRVPALERTAWREGLRKARGLEQGASLAFRDAAARVLRTGDWIAHDAGSDVFVAALSARGRKDARPTAPIEVRSALARITATVELAMQLEITNGWTMYAPAADGGTLSSAIERALLTGSQERERFAFFSAIGHELRTPLASIRGYLETLRDDDIAPMLRRRFVAIAYNESLRLGRLVDGMFEISLLDLHAASGPQHAGSLAAAVRASVEACAASAAKRSVRIECGPIRPLAVHMTEDRLTLVLINLLENAVKHGRLGGCVRVTMRRDASQFVDLCIDDDGPGIPAAQRERIFGFGERGATSAGGNGIGLALVRLLLHRAGGKVEVRDAPSGGARFVVTLARAQAAPTGCAE